MITADSPRPENAREAVFLSLQAMREGGIYSDRALHFYMEQGNLDARERGLAARLLYGVLQNRYLCDYYIRCYSKLRLKKIQPQVLDVLELAAYQILFMDRIPNSAAINESLNLLKRFGRVQTKTIGFANGLLRHLARQAGNLPPLAGESKAEYYSIQYSHKAWMVEAWLSQFGLQQTKAILQANQQIPPLCLRVNLLKSSAADVLERLKAENISAFLHPQIPNLILCPEGFSLAGHPLFLQGEITVQDGASMTAVDVLSPGKGSFVLDCCAAPGGKSFYLSEKMENTGTVISCDISPEKLRKIQEGSLRLGLSNIETRCQDGSRFVPEWAGQAVFVLCDVPCSGLGIIRKKPEIRYKSEEELLHLPELQLKILSNAARYVKKGGSLVYSTCTILPRENQDVVERFLQETPEFHLSPFETPVTGYCRQGFFTFLPGERETDGFFIAKLSKI